MKWNNKLSSLLALSLLLTTCSGGTGGGENNPRAGEQSKPGEPINREPVEVVFAFALGKTPEEFEKEIG